MYLGKELLGDDWCLSLVTPFLYICTMGKHGSKNFGRGALYFLKSEKFFKIGVTKRKVEERIKEIESFTEYFDLDSFDLKYLAQIVKNFELRRSINSSNSNKV